MSDTNAVDAVAEGRPSAGAELAATLSEAAARRPKSRDVKNLVHLVPFISAHWRHSAAAGFFLLFSTGATLSITQALPLVVE